MKTLKLAAFALTLGLFAASCGDTTNNETTVVDSPAVEAPVEAPVEPTPAPVDTTVSTTTTVDTTVAPAPAK